VRCVDPTKQVRSRAIGILAEGGEASARYGCSKVPGAMLGDRLALYRGLG
jgi:hypothetical protein